MQLFAKLKKILRSGFRATLNFCERFYLKGWSSLACGCGCEKSERNHPQNQDHLRFGKRVHLGCSSVVRRITQAMKQEAMKTSRNPV